MPHVCNPPLTGRDIWGQPHRPIPFQFGGLQVSQESRMHRSILNTILYNESPSLSLYCPTCILITAAAGVFSTPFRLDLPQQEPPHPTLRPLSESFSPPLPSLQNWGPIDYPSQVAEGSSHKLPTTFVQALSSAQKEGKWTRHDIAPIRRQLLIKAASAPAETSACCLREPWLRRLQLQWNGG